MKSIGSLPPVGALAVQLEEARQEVQDLQLQEQALQETVHTQESQVWGLGGSDGHLGVGTRRELWAPGCGD